jgi:TonB family protein
MIRKIYLHALAVAFAGALSSTVIAQSGDAAQYKQQVAQKIAMASKTKPTKAGVRALSVVGYTIDGQGQVVDSWIVRSAGEKALDDRALAMFKQALPLPAPPASIFGTDSHVHLSEAFVFTTDGQYRLQSLIK